jgi:hypothetical protein
MIKIEITGNSTVELADKMLGIAGSLLAADYRRIYAARQALEGKAEVAEAAPVDPTPAAEPAATPASSSKQAEVSTGTSAPVALDFDTDVAPHVLAVVQKLGKPAAQEILSQFGVEKASLLDPARWPELVTALQDAS